MKKSNWLCFGMPVTEEPNIRVIRVSRLPTFRPPPKTENRYRDPKTENHAAQSPRFDDRKGVEKTFGMAKWRKSQKILRDKKQTKDPADYIPTQRGFQERPVDVPHDYHEHFSENVSKENATHHSQQASKSCTNTPNLSRPRNRSRRFNRSKKAVQSLPTRRVKNFTPFDQ